MAKFVRRDEEQSRNGAVSPGLTWGDWTEKYPAIVEYMSLTAWDDGKPRATATLTLFLDEGRIKVRFFDRAKSRTLWASAESLAELLDALEVDLAQGIGEWRRERSYQQKK